MVNRNAQIPLRGGLQNGWYPVVCFGQDGWILGNYTATVAPPTGTATATPSPSLTSTPTNTATVTPTLIPLEGTAFLQANANCRVGPGTGFASLGVVNRNAQIPLRGGLQNGWYPVVCFGQDGWILGNYIAVQTPTPTATATATLPSSGSVVTTVTVNCRTGPSTTSPVIVVVATGTTLTLRGATEGEWTPVTCGGQDGWITSRFLR
ncbi:MAG: SH3 domain-containing protein [Thermomicrobiales bacterium]|nr:SH3 domain-containing protein [Thermomicrobiales bacterium]